MKVNIDETQEEFLFEALKDAKVATIQMKMRATIKGDDPRFLNYLDTKLSHYQKLSDDLAYQINSQRDAVWFVHKSGNKYFDGYFGADGNIHSPEQIFTKENFPYEEGYGKYIEVGRGEIPPTPSQVQEFLNKDNL